MGYATVMRRMGLLVVTLGASCTSTQQAAEPAAAPARAAAKPTKPSHPTASLVLLGGVVRTQDPSNLRATAIAVDGAKIVAVGTDDEVERWIGPSTKAIGLYGHTVVPGLVDSHMHLFGLGRRQFDVDLTGTESIAQIKSKIARAVSRTSPGRWIRGRGWDQNDWSGSEKGRWPSAKDLDRIAPNNPLYLRRVDGHAVWVNSKAMKIAGVDRKSRSPRGGKIIKRGGRPTGVFIDNASSLISGHVPPPNEAELRRMALLGQQQCLDVGLAQVHDMGIGPTELKILRELDAAGDLKLRVYAMLDGSVEDLSALMGKRPEIPEPFGDKRLTVRGVKFYADGALGSRGAALLKPYSDDRRNKGLLVTDRDLLEARIRSARTRGYQVATHAIGDRANRMVLDIYERVFGIDGGKARPRVEHAQVISFEDLPRFGKLGIIASMQPTHATSDMPWAEKRVGPDRIGGAYAWRSLMAYTATIASGSDAPVEQISPILGLYAAMTRRDLEGFPPSGWRIGEAMSSTVALQSFTRGGAWASFREDHAGLLAVGNVADLTVLDMDPISADPIELLGAKAELTIVGGKIAHARKGAQRVWVKPKKKPAPKKAKPRPKAKAKPKAQPKPAPKPQPKPAPKAQPKPAPKAQPKPQPEKAPPPSAKPAPAKSTRPAEGRPAPAPKTKTPTTAPSQKRLPKKKPSKTPNRGPGI